jgi:hypothetical protein
MAPGGDEDSKMKIAFPILMTNQGCFTFCKKLFWSNDHFLAEWNHKFSKKAFGQMNFWSNYLSVKRPFSELDFGQMNFRSNELSVKWTFGQMSFQSNDHFTNKAFGQMNFWSNVISVIHDLASWVLYVAINTHKKQLSDFFVELYNTWMVDICPNTCDTHLLLVFWL